VQGRALPAPGGLAGEGKRGRILTVLTIRIQTENGKFIESDTVCPGCWVDVRNVSEGDIARLKTGFGIERDLLDDILDADEQSRIQQEDNYTAIIIRVPVLDLTLNVAYYTVPLAIILFTDKVITICQRSSGAIEDIACNRVRGFVMRNRSAFVLHILERAAFTYLKALKELNKNAARIEIVLQKSVENNELIQLLYVQKSLVYFTTSLKSNGILLEKMQKSAFLNFKVEENDLLDDVIIDNVQALEMANIYSSIMMGTMDAFASVISNNLNIVMKRLAIINIVLMIPTLIYSFYGMNITLPGQGHPFAVLAVVMLSAAASVIGVLFLNKGNRQRKRIVRGRIRL